MNHIPYSRPSITELEIAYATNAAKYGWGPRCYEYIEQFEHMFADWLGVKYAIATSSCTGAMTLGLAALDIGEGDKVILADTNWIATVAPIVHAGAQPLFVDIDPVTWCIDWETIERELYGSSKQISAIIATHIYGNPCNMGKLLSIGFRAGIPIIEDAAEAIGTQYRGSRAGSIGKFGVFSFHGTKTITTGEGGMFVTNDERLYEKALSLSNHGRVRGQAKQFFPEMIGYKFKMSNVQAAIGCAQMRRVDGLVLRKRDIFQYYCAEIAHLPGVSMNPEPVGTLNGYWMPTVVFDKEIRVTREMLLEAFAAANIDARVFFHPLSSLPMFHSKPWKNPVAYDIPKRAINLPSFHDITDEEQDRVIAVVKGVLK